MQFIALADGYESLRKLLIARRRELGLTQLEVDDIAGFQSGYTGKLECRARNFGPMSLSSILGALGVELAVVAKRDLHPAVQRQIAERAAKAHTVVDGRRVIACDRKSALAGG